eukprot:SAG31_NODE_5851_length_2296_cov_1.316340_2_plen_265_part_00
MICLDLPAHGSRCNQALDIDAAVACVHEAMCAEVGVVDGSERALVCGVGFGGYVAMAFAAAHPERICGLLLASCTVSFTTQSDGQLCAANGADASSQVILSSAATRGWGNGPAVLSTVLGTVFGGWPGQMAATQTATSSSVLPASHLAATIAKLYAAVPAELRRECFLRPGFFLSKRIWDAAKRVLSAPPGGRSWLDVASSISVPVMLLNSEDSESRCDEQAFLEALDCGTLVIVRRTVHAALEDPQSFNEHIANFANNLGFSE